MKKQLVLGLGLAIIASPAFASKARLQALGEATDGSFYINDNRNIFLNSAQVNNHKDLVTMEWGTGSGVEGADNAPNAEGGIYKSHNNMTYGLQLGRGQTFNTLAETVAAGAFDASNALDLFVGGDAGFKWGANVSYATANNKTATAKEDATVLDVNLGAIFGDFTAYVNYGAMGDSQNKLGVTPYKIERKNALEVGGSYQMNEYTIFGQYAMADYENKKGAKNDTDVTSYLVGVGRNAKLNDKTTLFTKIQYSSNEQKTKPATASYLDNQQVPVTVGLEYDAASWVAIRGSVAQNIWSTEKFGAAKSERTVANSTNVNAGATLKFGDLALDGVIGTNNNTTQAIDTTTTEKGILSLDNLMTRVALTYKF